MSQYPVKKYTREVVSKHNNIDSSCWVIIDNSVYDITYFSKVHPGSPKPFIKYGGQDVSLKFHDLGHSANAYAQLSQFHIGEIVEEEHKSTVQLRKEAGRQK